MDKREVEESQAETVYQLAIARAIAHAVECHPRLHIYVDKRYTNPHQRMSLERRVREAIAHIPDQVVIIDQESSVTLPGLQAVDFVAWALRRKCEGDEEWSALIEERVMVLESVKGNKIAALPGGR